jgi:hypothetical protein
MDSDSPVASRIAGWTHPTTTASPFFLAMVTMRSTPEFLRDWLSNSFGTKFGSISSTITSQGEPRSHYPRSTGYGRPA